MRKPKTKPAIYVDSDIDLPDVGVRYLHCARCLEEWRTIYTDVNPREYARQQAALTEDGLQVWCTRCERNIALFRFEDGRVRR